MLSGNTDFIGVMISIIAILVIIIFLWAIYTFFVAIFQFIFSKWEQEKVKKARDNIRYMILWILLSIALLFLFPYVAKKLELPWYERFTASNIFDRASSIFNFLKDDTAKNIDWQIRIDSQNDWDYIEL